MLVHDKVNFTFRGPKNCMISTHETTTSMNVLISKNRTKNVNENNYVVSGEDYVILLLSSIGMSMKTGNVVIGNEFRK